MWEKHFQHPPPLPPPKFLFIPIFFLMLEIPWNAKKTWNFEKKIFFSIFKKFIKNSNNIPSISKTIQHTPMTWCTPPWLGARTCKVSRKYSNAFLVTVRKLNVTDGQTDAGRCNISRPRYFYSLTKIKSLVTF